jgi:hypothetical protein
VDVIAVAITCALVAAGFLDELAGLEEEVTLTVVTCGILRIAAICIGRTEIHARPLDDGAGSDTRAFEVLCGRAVIIGRALVRACARDGHTLERLTDGVGLAGGNV